MRAVIGVMGGAVADESVIADARTIGRLVAEHDLVLLNGGRDAGVMAASAKGAADAGGLVVGILPGDTRDGVAAGVTVAIPTGMGDARNAINVLASDVVIALAGGAGTLSEIALALKADTPVVTVAFDPGPAFAAHVSCGLLTVAPDAESAFAAALAKLRRASR